MGLTIRDTEGEVIYDYSYSMLHEIRKIALKICGYKGAISRFYKIDEKDDRVKPAYRNFYQLLHFSDCDGILVPYFYLNGANLSNSLHLGNSNKLLRELEVIDEYLKIYPNKFVKDKNIIQAFKDLIAVVRYNVDEGDGIIKFT